MQTRFSPVCVDYNTVLTTNHWQESQSAHIQLPSSSRPSESLGEEAYLYDFIYRVKIPQPFLETSGLNPAYISQLVYNHEVQSLLQVWSGLSSDRGSKREKIIDRITAAALSLCYTSYKLEVGDIFFSCRGLRREHSRKGCHLNQALQYKMHVPGHSLIVMDHRNIMLTINGAWIYKVSINRSKGMLDYYIAFFLRNKASVLTVLV